LGYNFITADRKQDFLLAPSLEDWLPKGHLARFLIDVVAEMKLSAFYAKRRSDGWGRAAYEPSMMVTLLLYAACTGTRSSRAIERRCVEDIAYRYITAGNCPDHATVARFRAGHEEALTGLFKEALRLCAEAGLVSVGVVALDGTKLAANAALAANRTAEGIDKEIEKEVRQMLKEMADADAAQDALFGPDKRGDELPEELSNPHSRLERLKAAKQRLERQDKAAQDDYQAKKDRVDKALEETGRRPRGRPPKAPQERAKQPSKQANLTDPDSRIMQGPDGALQGYNAQNVVNENQIVLASDVTQDGNDVRQLAPMLDEANKNLAAAGVSTGIGVLLADAGYNSEENLSVEGPELLIATTKEARQRAATSPAPRGRIPKGLKPRQLMERKLATKRGRALYRRRACIVEPVFGQHHERGFNQFSRRGLQACRAEWSFENTCHNLLKLWRSGKHPSR
jgi:transposase